MEYLIINFLLVYRKSKNNILFNVLFFADDKEVMKNIINI